MIDLHFFNVFYPLVPCLFIALLLSWLWIPLTKKVINNVKALKTTFNWEQLSINFSFVRLNTKTLILCLLVIFGIGVFVSCYPLLTTSGFSLVGSDSAIYYIWMEDMSEKGPWIALQTDRPLSNLLMFFIQHSFALSSDTIVKVMPVICCVTLSLAVFWFVRVGLNNDVLALASALFTVLGFQTTVGIYAYSVSNWLALTWAFIFFGLILKSSKNNSWAYVITAAFFGVALLFTHPYTWDVIIGVLFAYLLWELLTILKTPGNNGYKHIFQLFFVLILNFAAYGLYSILPFGKSVTSGVSFAGRNLALPNIMNLPEGLKTIVEMWVGGVYANSLLILLAIMGMFAIILFASKFNRLMLLWVAVPSLALFFVSEDYLLYRLLYVIPVQILAVLGIFWVFEVVEKKYILKNNKVYLACKVVGLLLIFLIMLNYSLRSVEGAPLHLL